MNTIFAGIPAHERRMTLATLFTLMRVILTPFIVVAMVYHYWVLACCLFMCAALTDIIDGYLARRLNQKTLLGACLDPIADKILLLSCFGTLAFVDTPFFTIPYWFFYMICLKEIVQLCGGVTLFLFKKNTVIEATALGKVATLVHIFFITWLFLCYFFSWMPLKTDYFLLGLSGVLVIVSFINYLVIGLKRYINQHEDQL